MMRRLVAAAVLAAATSGAPVVFAQNADEQAARASFKQGLVLHEKRDYEGALDKYREAYVHWKNPKILANIGTAAWELGRFADAADAYDRYLETAPSDDPSRAEVEKALADVLPKVGTLRVKLEGNASVALDGHSVAVEHLDKVRVMPGSHTLGANFGSELATSDVKVAAGETLDVVLAPRRKAEPQRSGGTVTVRPHRMMSSSVLPYIVGGAGLASLGASGVFFILRGSAVDKLDRHCLGDVCPTSQKDNVDTANTFGLVGAITLGVGVAALGTGIVLLVLDQKHEKQDETGTVRVGVLATPRFAAASMGVRF